MSQKRYFVFSFSNIRTNIDLRDGYIPWIDGKISLFGLKRGGIMETPAVDDSISLPAASPLGVRTSSHTRGGLGKVTHSGDT